MRRLENCDDIEKIEAVLFQVSPSFSFIPFKAHGIYVHNLCSQSRFSPVRKLLSSCLVFRNFGAAESRVLPEP